MIFTRLPPFCNWALRPGGALFIFLAPTGLLSTGLLVAPTGLLSTGLLVAPSGRLNIGLFLAVGLLRTGRLRLRMRPLLFSVKGVTILFFTLSNNMSLTARLPWWIKASLMLLRFPTTSRPACNAACNILRPPPPFPWRSWPRLWNPIRVDRG